MEKLIAQKTAEQQKEVLKAKNEDDNNSALDQIKQEYEDSDVGPPVSAQMATILPTMVKEKMDETKISQIFEAHKTQQNCDSLVVPKVNPEILSIMDCNSKIADLAQ